MRIMIIILLIKNAYHNAIIAMCWGGELGRKRHYIVLATLLYIKMEKF